MVRTLITAVFINIWLSLILTFLIHPIKVHSRACFFLSVLVCQVTHLLWTLTLILVSFINSRLLALTSGCHSQSAAVPENSIITPSYTQLFRNSIIWTFLPFIKFMTAYECLIEKAVNVSRPTDCMNCFNLTSPCEKESQLVELKVHFVMYFEP